MLSEDVKNRTQSRMSRYEIRDPFLRFHFHYVYPHADLVQQKRTARLSEMVRATFDSYVGSTGYEDLARRLIARMGDEHRLPFSPDYVGRAWTRHAEIDVAAVNWKDKSVILGECKWQSGRVTDATLDDLAKRGEKMANFAGFKKHYALFSKAGFTASLEKRAAREHVLLFRGGAFDG
jgi:AAA+ ATPase superfamily predicted ATPase